MKTTTKPTPPLMADDLREAAKCAQVRASTFLRLGNLKRRKALLELAARLLAAAGRAANNNDQLMIERNTI